MFDISTIFADPTYPHGDGVSSAHLLKELGSAPTNLSVLLFPDGSCLCSLAASVDVYNGRAVENITRPPISRNVSFGLSASGAIGLGASGETTPEHIPAQTNASVDVTETTSSPSPILLNVDGAWTSASDHSLPVGGGTRVVEQSVTVPQSADPALISASDRVVSIAVPASNRSIEVPIVVNQAGNSVERRLEDSLIDNTRSTTIRPESEISTIIADVIHPHRSPTQEVTAAQSERPMIVSAMLKIKELMKDLKNRPHKYYYRPNKFVCWHRSHNLSVCVSTADFICLIQPTRYDSSGRPNPLRVSESLKVAKLSESDRASFEKLYGTIPRCRNFSWYIGIFL